MRTRRDRKGEVSYVALCREDRQENREREITGQRKKGSKIFSLLSPFSCDPPYSLLLSIFGFSGWQQNFEQRPAFGDIMCGNRSAVPLHDRAHDGQAETAPNRGRI